MTVKVVQGLVGASARLPLFESHQVNSAQAPNQAHDAASQAHAVQVATQVQASVAGNEAVITNVKSTHKSISPEKRLNPDQADKLAREVADRIREGDDAQSVDPHLGLDKVASSGAAKNHLSA